MKKTAKIISLILCVLIVLSAAFASASAAVTDAQTPISADEASLKWSLKLGTSYANAPSVPTVYGDYVIVMSRNTLYKLSAESGEIIQTAETADTPSFGYTPVTVADDIIFCPLENGTVRAFSFDSMESLWIYNDPLGGQALTPITVYDGCVYTGFWNDEELGANFVCLDAATGKSKWFYTQQGGFYWSECFVNKDFVVVGGDNGSGETEAKSALKCFDRLSGELIDTAEIIGDQRSGITENNGILYFVTKAGYFYKVPLSSEGKLGNAQALQLSGASTSTPTVYNGKAYIGVQPGSVKIIDIETMSVLGSVDMNGYPQSEFLLSTAYESESGNVYIYSTYNASPGGITVITDGQSNAAEQLYIPESGSRSYCISLVAVSEDGTLFYKNDSGTLFAVEKSAEIEEPAEEKSFFERIINLLLSFFKLIIKLFA